MTVAEETGGPNGFAEQPEEGLALPAWEERQRFGFLNALYLTIKDVMFSPGPFFARMPSRIGLGQPLLFAVVVGVISAFFTWMWSLTGSSLQMFVAEDLAEVFKGPLIYGASFMLSPVWIIAGVFVFAGIIHACLMLVGGNRLGFEATFRVVAYDQAVSICALVPFCGNIIALFWSLVVLIVGLHKIHDTDPWRAVVAIIVPVVLCCGGPLVLGGLLSMLLE
jgi:hypothetical protein